MTALHAIILGIIEGLTEFLPVSSTGHLIIASRLLGIADSDFTKSFEIIIQLGAILAVVLLYWRTLVRSFSLWVKLFVAFLPSAIIGLLLYSFIKTYLLGNIPVVLAALFLGGIVLIIFEYSRPKDETGDSGRAIASLTYKECLLIGLAQAVALVPGVSRSAATIVAARTLKLSRAAAVEFSFLLSIPTMAAATGLDLIKHADGFSADQFGILALGFAVSAVVAGFAIVGFMRFVRSHTFTSFGIYRIVASIVFFLILFA